MDRLDHYRELIRRILAQHASIPYSNADLRQEVVFDSEHDRYLLIALGRENKRRVHDCMIHVDIIDDKIWIQYDGTEYGVAQELIDAGVPRDHIVLGFKSPELRKHTEFATA